jgi:hypothetical protein
MAYFALEHLVFGFGGAISNYFVTDRAQKYERERGRRSIRISRVATFRSETSRSLEAVNDALNTGPLAAEQRNVSASVRDWTLAEGGTI